MKIMDKIFYNNIKMKQINEKIPLEDKSFFSI